MTRLGIRSVYELYLLGDIPRPTLHRWLVGAVRLPIAGARTLAATLAAQADRDDLVGEMEALLQTARLRGNQDSLLARECRARRVPYRRVVEAISAARLRVVPVDEHSNLNRGETLDEL